MQVPGSNLLNLAMTVIRKETFEFYAYTTRSSNDIGIYQDEYADPVTVTGSVQPVPRDLYAQMGLDFQKNYHTFYTPNSIGDVGRAKAGDKFVFNGSTYQCESTTPWFAMDGWTKCMCVQVPNDSVQNDYTNENGLPYTTEDGLQYYTTE